MSDRKETHVEKEAEKNIDAGEPLVTEEIKEVVKEEEKKVEAAKEAQGVVEEAKKIIETKERRIGPEGWRPKTQIGKDVFLGKITNPDQIFLDGLKNRESEVIDALIPDLEQEVLLIGGSSGKGGGIQRTKIRRTTRVHKSGRRFAISAMIAVGNKNGYVGVGMARGPPGKQREVLDKTLRKAKLNLIPIRRGCGSWECKCGGSHSIPFKTVGKCGSVKVELLPAPKGIGLCVFDEAKKVMKLAGIKDVWCKTRGKTHTRYNVLRAMFYALKKLNRVRITDEVSKKMGVKMGSV